MRRFVVAPEAVVGDDVVLRGREARHAALVVRTQVGDRVIVLDGSGVERVTELTAVGPDEVRGRIVETRQGAGRGVELVLVQGVPKGAKMDDVVRMGTELGVATFIPVRTRRTVAEARGRAERWRRIAQESAKQSRRADLPAVLDPVALPEALGLVASCDLILVLWEGERTRTIAGALREAGRPRRVALLVGPEGGLDEEEVRLAAEHGGVPVTLGPLVLRTETAGVVALAMVLYELDLRALE